VSGAAKASFLRYRASIERTIKNTTKEITKKLISATINAPAGQLVIAPTLAAFKAGWRTDPMTNVTTASTTLPKGQDDAKRRAHRCITAVKEDLLLIDDQRMLG